MIDHYISGYSLTHALEVQFVDWQYQFLTQFFQTYDIMYSNFGVSLVDHMDLVLVANINYVPPFSDFAYIKPIPLPRINNNTSRKA